MSEKAILDDALLERKIVSALKTRRGRASLADIVVDTGIPNIEVERMMRRMIGSYACHLDVTEDGEILYQFDPALRRLEKRGAWKRWSRWLGLKLWAAFSVLMKAMIWIIMVVYVVIFAILVIAATVAAASRGSSDDRDSSWGGGSERHGSGGFWFWYWVFGSSRDPYRSQEWQNPAYDRYGDGTRESKDKRPFYMKVYSFVLGPEQKDLTSIDDDPALLAFIRSRGGAVTTAEIASRTGWSLQQAEARLTKMVAHYEGNIIVTDDAELVFTFEQLLTTMGERGQRKPLGYFWERWERPMPLTGNDSGPNLLIGAFNAFNLVVALVAPSLLLNSLGIASSPEMLFFLSWFPFGFSLLVFLVPILRWLLWVTPENGRRRTRNCRRAIYQVLFERAAKTTTVLLAPKSVLEQARTALPGWEREAVANPDQLKRPLEEVRRDLNGDVSLDDDHAGDYDFSAIGAGLRAGEQTRKRLKSASAAPLRLAFSTREGDLLPA